MSLDWKIGFEIELLAPVGKSRREMAERIARQFSARVNPIFYPQSEPSKAPGVEVFENLVIGFDVLDDDGNLLARCVDDLTIRAGLDFNAPPKKNWYRIISDDARLLELVMGHCVPTDSQRQVLAPMSELFETQLDLSDNQMFKVMDKQRRSIAIAAPLPGERERVCEIITPPILIDHEEVLKSLLDCAIELGFSVPKEAAVHLHFDAKNLKKTRVLCRLVDVIFRHGEAIKQHVKSNPNCIRTGDISTALVQQCQQKGFSKIGWKPAVKILKALELTKYADFNFLNMVHDIPGKDTFEVRILPGSFDVDEIIVHAKFFENLLNWCCTVKPEVEIPQAFDQFLCRIENVASTS